MRILSITAQKPDSTGSGVYLTELVREFALLGHEQAVVAGIYQQDKPVFPQGVEFFPVYFKEGNLPFPIAGMSDEMPYESTVYSTMTEEMRDKFLAAFGKRLEQAITQFKPDVLLCHHLYLLTAFIRQKYPHMQVWGISHGTDLRQMEKNPLWRDFIREHICQLDKIFCLHEEQKGQIEAVYGVKAEKIQVVGNGYNCHIFYNTGSRTHHKQVRLVFAGKISEKKGVFSLLEALPHLGWAKEDFSLRLAGGWNSEEQKKMVQAKIDESGYDVTLLGNLSQQRLAEEFNQGDIFVLPTFYDGLPLVLAEALACGMKVICTDLPGIRPRFDEAVPGHGICFVEPPPMVNADEPVRSSLPAFARRLAETIINTAASPIPSADLTALCWSSVCQKMLK